VTVFELARGFLCEPLSFFHCVLILIFLIIGERAPGVATLTLNRPHARNALSLGLLQRLRCVLSHLAALPVAVGKSTAAADEHGMNGTGAGAAKATAVGNGSIGAARTGVDHNHHQQHQQQQMIMTNETAAQFLARVVGASASSASSSASLLSAPSLTSIGVRPRVIVLRGNGPVFSSGHDLKVRCFCSCDRQSVLGFSVVSILF
jgi:hypothetical protein